MTDIVERLRDHVMCHTGHECVLCTAAGEIDRLRAEVERYRTALEKIAMKPGEMIPIPVHYEMNSYGEGLRLNQNIARAALEDGK